jgi:superfamily II DNA or RNA helicase
MQTQTLTSKTSIPLRGWQTDCLLNLLGAVDKGETLLTVVATMGSGKTFLQGAFARALLDAGKIDWVVNVVPSDVLRENNSKNLREHFSIDISGYPTSVHHGHVVTFQGLSRTGTAERLLRQLEGKKYLLMIDEVHHGSAEGTAWGDSILSLMDDAAYTLSLSGTMWRTDQSKIAGVRYKQLNPHLYEVDPHYVYSLGDATKDNTVSSVVFHELAAEVTYMVDDEDGQRLVTVATNNLRDNDEVNRAYKHVINPKGGFAFDLIERAHEELIAKQREHFANHPLDIPPGGLVVCADIEAAEKVTKLLFKHTGKLPVLVHSGTPDGKERIAQFAKHELPADWLVSVRMVSEGVDVPRIKVIAYLSSVRTKLSFHQIVGRAMRIRRSLTGEVMNETAAVFLPAFASLHAHVLSFTNEMRLTIGEWQPVKPREQEEEQVNDTVPRKEELLHSAGTFWEPFLNGILLFLEQASVKLKEAVLAS